MIFFQKIHNGLLLVINPDMRFLYEEMGYKKTGSIRAGLSGIIVK